MCPAGLFFLRQQIHHIIKKYIAFVKHYQSGEMDRTDGIGMPHDSLTAFCFSRAGLHATKRYSLRRKSAKMGFRTTASPPISMSFSAADH